MYSWEEVQRAVKHEEDKRLEESLAELEVKEGHVVHGIYVMRRSRPYVTLLGGLVVGLYVSLITMAFNYLLFVWILHVNFDL